MTAYSGYDTARKHHHTLREKPKMSKELMLRIATESREESDTAFEELVAEYQPMVTAYAFSKLRDWSIAEDIAQGVMLTIWKCASTYHDESFMGWLFTIAENRIIDEARRRMCDPIHLAARQSEDCDPFHRSSVDERSPLDEMIVQESATRAAMALELIPPDQRATIELFAEGFSLPEIADASGVCLATTKGRVRCGRHNLSKMVEI